MAVQKRYNKKLAIGVSLMCMAIAGATMYGANSEYMQGKFSAIQKNTQPDLVMKEIFIDQHKVLNVKFANESDVFLKNTESTVEISYDGKLDRTYAWSTLENTEFFAPHGVTTIFSEPLANATVVVACVDPENKVKESNESNNCRQSTINYPPAET